MNNTKSPKNVSLKNQLELWLFCALIGAVAGALVWILLKIMAVGTEFLWKWFPGKTSVPYYTILICVAGAAIIGIFQIAAGTKVYKSSKGKGILSIVCGVLSVIVSIISFTHPILTMISAGYMIAFSVLMQGINMIVLGINFGKTEN